MAQINPNLHQVNTFYTYNNSKSLEVETTEDAAVLSQQNSQAVQPNTRIYVPNAEAKLPVAQTPTETVAVPETTPAASEDPTELAQKEKALEAKKLQLGTIDKDLVAKQAKLDNWKWTQGGVQKIILKNQIKKLTKEKIKLEDEIASLQRDIENIKNPKGKTMLQTPHVV